MNFAFGRPPKQVQGTRNLPHASRINSEQLGRLASQLMPGGVNTPIRSFDRVGGNARFIAKASGYTLTDVDGNSYLDYVGSWGAAILGHGHPDFVASVTSALREGASIGLSSPHEVYLTSDIKARVPNIERVRLVNTGTEAVLSAIRLARHHTRREILLKFEGCYHGQVDDLMRGAIATRSTPEARPANNDRLLIIPYNDINALRSCFAEYGNKIAAAIVEPIAANMGVVAPASGFLEVLRKLATSHGALLIFDEVVTGFRLSRGGAQEHFNLSADIIVMGKALAGGLPVGAYGGRQEIMSGLAPEGPVYQGGTFSGNPATCAAGLATLALLTDENYALLQSMGDHLRDGLTKLIHKHGVRAAVQQAGSMLSIYFGIDHVSNYADAAQADRTAYANFFHSMLELGVHLPPRPLEAWFISLAHDHNVIDRTLGHINVALRKLA